MLHGPSGGRAAGRGEGAVAGAGWKRQGSQPTLAKAGNSLAAKQEAVLPQRISGVEEGKISFKSQQFIVAS